MPCESHCGEAPIHGDVNPFFIFSSRYLRSISSSIIDNRLRASKMPCIRVAVWDTILLVGEIMLNLPIPIVSREGNWFHQFEFADPVCLERTCLFLGILLPFGTGC